MTGLKNTVGNIARNRRRWQEALSPGPNGSPRSALREVVGFGANGGELRMWTYVPDGLPAGAPLVVALHGCDQTAAAYDHASGWSTMADRCGFALLLPEQRTSNNQKGCFNWFLPGDARRDRGEARSIRDMVERFVRDEELDPTRVFITGASAGGAMTSVMLATYPEVFAAGAILAGLPYGGVTNVQQAMESMYQGKSRPVLEWAYFVRRASSHTGPWPRVSVWHGSADKTVHPMNAGETIKQWTELHGVSLYPTEAGLHDGHQYRVWVGRGGEKVLESYSIAGMGHGIPIARGDVEGACGSVSAYTLDVGISSTHHIARFWGLSDRVHEALASNSHRNPAGAKMRRTLPLGS